MSRPLAARRSPRIALGILRMQTWSDVLIVEPNEAHTVLSSSEDYLHFVVHTPGLQAAEAAAERSPVSRDRLGF